MAGTLNALGLLLVIGLTIVVLRKHGRFPRHLLSILFGLLIASFSLIIASFFTVHMCNAGQPVTQLLIPGICFVICYVALEAQPPSWWWLIMLFFAPLALGFHFTMVVHSDGYTGNPRSGNRALLSQQRSDLQLLKGYYEERLEANNSSWDSSYTPGPLATSGAWQVLVDRIDDSEREGVVYLLTSKEFETYRLWHSWLTGIYGQRSHPLKLWYPGGKLQDAIGRFKYRR